MSTIASKGSTSVLGPCMEAGTAQGRFLAAQLTRQQVLVDRQQQDEDGTIEKARRLLGYSPAYEPEQAILESVRWLIDHDQLVVSQPLQV